MSAQPKRKWFSIIVAAAVIFCAAGQIANWNPFGVGALVRSGLSVIGITGGILLICRRRLAWTFLLPWAVLQMPVWITDRSGRWFFQSLWMGTLNLTTISSNNSVVSQEGHGFNFVGCLWLGVFLTMLMFRLHPPMRPLFEIPPASRRRLWAITAVTVALLTGWQIYGYQLRSRADLVIGSDIPGTSVYYRDRFLGYTPLAITQSRIKAWQLPLEPGQPLRLHNTDWTQRLLISTSDPHSEVVLDVNTPFFAPTPKIIPTPWGLRSASSAGAYHEGSNYRRRIIWYENTKNSLQLMLEPLEPGPYLPGQSVKLKCILTNPASEVSGVASSIRVMCWGFDMTWSAPTPTREHRRTASTNMPVEWSHWPTGTARTESVDFEMPLQAGYYTLMAVFNLFADDQHCKLSVGSPYSNYLLIQVAESDSPSKTEPSADSAITPLAPQSPQTD